MSVSFIAALPDDERARVLAQIEALTAWHPALRGQQTPKRFPYTTLACHRERVPGLQCATVARTLLRHQRIQHARLHVPCNAIGQPVEHGIRRGRLGAKGAFKRRGPQTEAMQVHAQHVARRVLPGDAGDGPRATSPLAAMAGCWAVWPWWIS